MLDRLTTVISTPPVQTHVVLTPARAAKATLGMALNVISMQVRSLLFMYC